MLMPEANLLSYSTFSKNETKIKCSTLPVRKNEEILVVEQEFEVCREKDMKGSPLTFNIFAL